MAGEGKNVYPKLPAKNWWDLRKKFIRTIPTGEVSDTYLASVLNISPKAAGNLIPDLKKVGIINQEGIVSERAKSWRDDEQYKQVCETVRKEVYPQELIDAFGSPSEEDRSAIESWFANKTGLGEVAVRRIASFYLLLCEGDPEKSTEKIVTKQKAETKETAKNIRVTTPRIIPPNQNKNDNKEELNTPSININIQVHISSDASTTQIDQIFASMAKHLNIRRKNNNE